MAVISFKSLAGIPREIAMETQSLYSKEPIITAVVDFIKETFRNRLVPMITLASPMVMVPVPIRISDNK